MKHLGRHVHVHPQILPGHYVIKQNLFLLKTLYVYVCASRILRPSDLLPSLQLSRYRKLFHSSSSNSVIPVPYWPSGLRTRVWKTRKYPKPDPTRIFRVFWCLTCETWTLIEWNHEPDPDPNFGFGFFPGFRVYHVGHPTNSQNSSNMTRIISLHLV